MPVCPNCGKKVEEWATFCPYCGSKIFDKNKLKLEIDKLKFKEKLGMALVILCGLTALPFIIMGQDDVPFFIAMMAGTIFSAVSLHYNRMRAKLEEIYKKGK